MRRNGDVHAILERAASEGRPPAPADDGARHEAVLPAMHCQVCGRRLIVRSLTDEPIALIVWHDPEPET